ncbi:MAG: helix-turn-helix domain-containing protein [Ruminococcus sp.]|nr:helix-turn-helix domain-containing protein [Ruminococcus sp.]
MLYSMCKSMGERVRKRREKLGYTREELAEKLDISVTFAAEIELGKKGMSLDTLVRVCELLSVSADYILWGKEERQENPIADMTAFLDDTEMKHAEELMRAYVKAVGDMKYRNIK